MLVPGRALFCTPNGHCDMNPEFDVHFPLDTALYHTHSESNSLHEYVQLRGISRHTYHDDM